MNRLKQARKAKGMTQLEVSQVIGLTQGAYSGWENGRYKIDNLSLSRLAELFDCSVDYLLGADIPPRSTTRIPVYAAVAAGIPIEAIEDIVDYEEIDAALAATGDFFGLRIKGDSMEPRMREGDVVIVRKQEDADNGDIVIVLVNGNDATVKKLKKEPNGITLIPFNPVHDTQYYSPEAITSLPVRIIGKVVELRAKF